MKKTGEKFLLICLVVFAAAFILVSSSCSKNNLKSSRSDNNFEITLAFSTNTEDPRAQASLEFKNIVEANTNGRIKIHIVANGGGFGGDAQLIAAVLANKLDMVVSSAGNFSVYVPGLGLSALPFLFSDFESAWKFMDSDFVYTINKNSEDYNFVILSYFDNGFRCVTTTDRPVNTVKDMNGLIIRTPSNQIVMETMSQLGAIPKAYSFVDLKAALKDGLFQGQENPIPVIYYNRLYDVQSYIAITNHSYDSMPFVIRKSLWTQFSTTDQMILKNAAIQAQNKNRQMVKKQTEDLLAELEKNGMTVTRPDLNQFKTATSSVMDIFTPIYGKEVIYSLKRYLEENIYSK